MSLLRGSDDPPKSYVSRRSIDPLLCVSSHSRHICREREQAAESLRRPPFHTSISLLHRLFPKQSICSVFYHIQAASLVGVACDFADTSRHPVSLGPSYTSLWMYKSFTVLGLHVGRFHSADHRTTAASLCYHLFPHHSRCSTRHPLACPQCRLFKKTSEVWVRFLSFWPPDQWLQRGLWCRTSVIWNLIGWIFPEEWIPSICPQNCHRWDAHHSEDFVSKVLFLLSARRALFNFLIHFFRTFMYFIFFLVSVWRFGLSLISQWAMLWATLNLV